METKFERIVGATISVRVDYQTLDDIVVTALEGGIGWWACLDNTGPEWDDEPEKMATSEYAALLIANGKKLKFSDATGELEENEEPKCPWEVDADTIINGIGLYLESEGGTNILTDGKLNSMKIDADVASDIFQFGIFGDCVFG